MSDPPENPLDPDEVLGPGAAKFMRSVRHNETLRDAIKAWSEGAPAELEPAERDDGSVDLLLRWRLRPPLKEWAVLLGDVIHNLRSSLDHLVWANSSTPDSNSAFPIHGSRHDFDRRWRSQLVGVPDEVQQAIVAMRPYRGGGQRGDRLWHLHQLDIQDKHRLILPVGFAQSSVGIPWPDLGPEWDTSSIPPVFLRPEDNQFGFEDGAVMMRFEAAARAPAVEAKTIVAATVVLGKDGADANMSLGESITQLSLEVEHTLRELVALGKAPPDDGPT